MSAEDRDARNGRDQTVASVVATAQRAWAGRAERLEQLGLRMIEEASAAAPASGAAGRVQARLKAGLELLDAADKIWLRLGRVLPRPSAAPVAPATSLDAYRTRRPRTG